MTSGCMFELEDMCVWENEEYGVSIPPHSCPHEGPDGRCTALPHELEELCEFCLKPACEGECLLKTVSSEQSRGAKE